ncbi:malonyl-ACP O-methyltransferase BioC [Psychromonas hadalis]|uniref:malonyl-ACP O-methyltransferase BioC n=1 Tax=Psychromonas hadalis TaxID=211669 RepID=UPI0003B70AB9|nr:malonyl-ACP O-methyltransferase BioC [Psychromonas hadalis]
MSQNIDKQAVADSFSKAAHHYDQFAQLQRDIGEQLLTSVPNKNYSMIVDLGCGTGYFSEKLAHQFPRGVLTCFDLSEAMLKQVKKRNINKVTFQQGDIDQLPFTENSIDLIYSNLVVQWSDDLAECLQQIKNSLKKGGRGYLSTLLGGTLHELTQAWKTVDKNPHTNQFLSLEKIQAILKQLSVDSVILKTETRTLHYKNVIEVMRALKGIGANHVHEHQTQAISGRKLLKQLEVGYLPFTNKQGLLTLTYQVCYIEIIK